MDKTDKNNPKTKDVLEGLNEKQKEAVLNTEGPLLIIAGAGSGKTKALTHRISHLIDKGIPPSSILALTFTNKAANEMRERINRLVKKPKIYRGSKSFIGTFHALGVRILRSQIGLLGRSPDFVIYDTKDQRALVKEIMNSHEIPQDKFRPAGILASISKQKNELVTAQEYFKKAKDFYEKIVAKVWAEYEKTLERSNAVDFDDLLVLPVKIFRKFPNTLSNYQRTFRYVLVDEYQDTNHAQYIFLKLLANAHKNICVVGDDWQSIYGFRGADFRNILNFEKDYPNTKIVILEENYRSTQNILDAAQAVIEENILRTDKNLWTKKPKGKKLKIVEEESEIEEGFFVANEIENLLAEKGSPVNSLNDVVILYRTNAQSRVLEETLINRGLPYKIIGSVRFYERREIKDLIAYLRLIQNPDDEISLRRIANTPPRGIGKATLAQLLEQKDLDPSRIGNKKIRDFLELIESFRKSVEEIKLSTLLKNIIKNTRYEKYIKDGTPEGESRWENVKEFEGVAQKFDNLSGVEALTSFLEEISLLAPVDEVNEKSGALNLMTLHSVKGLEFPVVFIVGCEEGLLPHEKSVFSPQDLEEERRLCYVGITRAKSLVYFVFTRQRTIFGSTQVNLPSRFLGNIPEELVEFSNFSGNGETIIEID